MERGVVRAAVGTLLVHAIPPRTALTAVVAVVRACAHGSYGAHTTQNNRWRAHKLAIDGDSRWSA